MAPVSNKIRLRGSLTIMGKDGNIVYGNIVHPKQYNCAKDIVNGNIIYKIVFLKQRGHHEKPGQSWYGCWEPVLGT